MTGGNLTRVPDRLDKWYWACDRAGAAAAGSVSRQADRRPDRSDDQLRLGNELARSEDACRRIRAQWTGMLEVPREGQWTFYSRATTDRSCSSTSDRRWTMADCTRCRSGRERADERWGARCQARLPATRRAGGSELEWEGGSAAGRPSDVLRTAMARADCASTRRARLSARSSGRSIAGFERIGVRYVVTVRGNACCRRRSVLRETYRGEGVRIFEVPD